MFGDTDSDVEAAVLRMVINGGNNGSGLIIVAEVSTT
jgi:hypothetical protein